jgi:hypothetical protein
VRMVAGAPGVGKVPHLFVDISCGGKGKNYVPCSKSKPPPQQ